MHKAFLNVKEKMDEEKSPSVKAERKRVYKSIFGPQSDSSSESSSSSSSSDSDDEFSPQTGKLEVKNEIKENSKEESENTESVEDKGKNKMNPIKEECSASQKLTEESVSSGIPDLLSKDQKAMLKELLVNELKCAVDAVAGDKTDSADDSPDRPTQLYMGPYGKIRSPFKKVSSLQTYSKQCKETQRKLTSPPRKRARLFVVEDDQDGNLSVEEGDSSDEEPGDTSNQQLKEQQGVVSGDESSEGEGLQIDESDQDMDGKLDGKSNKFALSAINVKSIIHKIITNESVVEMVRKAVQEEMAGKEFEYEPKLTRAKLKQFEAQGQVPVNWGLSPVKRPKAESPNFLEMELPEEEDDDEDFNPDKVVPESDEDSESVVSSSYVSDIGSPAPSTPLSAPVTPGLNDSTTRADITPTNLDSDISQQSLLSPMGPPLVVNVPRSNKKPSCLQQRFKESEEIIALRTRSKCPLKDQTIFDLEANFVAPDISEDLYDTSCDDNDWKTFLVDFSRLQPDTTLTGSMGAWLDEDDEEADPEYNFLEEQEEFDHEDFRNDRAVKVSKREVNQLLDELYSSLGDNDPLNEDVRQSIKVQSEKIVLHSDTRKRYEQRLILEIGDGERRQIHDQMRKHVQLLTQTFVLAEGNTELQPVADTAAMYLRELHHFGSGSAADTQQRSHFWACNLPGSLELLNTYRSVPIPALTEEDRDRLDLLDFRHDNQVLPSLTHRQMFVMWTNKVFMFPDLLPAGAFFRQCEIKRDRSRVKFLDSEDNLLAMGLAQFHHLSDSREYIQRFMLPCKSLKQIQIRIKNLRANAAKDNAVKYWCKFKVLPRFPQCAPEFTPDMMKAPCDSGLNLQEMPAWCKFFSGEEEEPYLGRDLREIQKIKRRKRRARLNASLEKPDESMLARSGCLTPVNELSGSSQFTSSSSGLSTDERSRPARPRQRRHPRSRSTKVSLPATLTNRTPCDQTHPVNVNMPGSTPVTSQFATTPAAPEASISSPMPGSSFLSMPLIIGSSPVKLFNTPLSVFNGQNTSVQTSNMSQTPGAPMHISISTPVNQTVPAPAVSQSPIKVYSFQSSTPLTYIPGRANSNGQPGIPTLVSCARPTIIVIQHDNSVHVQNFNTMQQNVASTSAVNATNTVTQPSTLNAMQQIPHFSNVLNFSNNAPNSFNSNLIQDPAPVTTHDTQDKKDSLVTLEQLFKPIMEAEMASEIDVLEHLDKFMPRTEVGSLNNVPITSGTEIQTSENTASVVESIKDKLTLPDNLIPMTDVKMVPCTVPVPSIQIGKKTESAPVIHASKSDSFPSVPEISSTKDDSLVSDDIEKCFVENSKTIFKHCTKQAINGLPLVNPYRSIIVSMMNGVETGHNNTVDNTEGAANNSRTTAATVQVEHNQNSNSNSSALPSEIQSEIITSTTPEQPGGASASDLGGAPRCLCTPTRELESGHTGLSSPANQPGARTALEMLASFAPVFMQTSPAMLTSHQLALETTPTKCGDRYVQVDPHTGSGSKSNLSGLQKSPKSTQTPRGRPRTQRSPKSTPRKIAPKPVPVKSPKSLPRMLAPKPLPPGSEMASVDLISVKTPKSGKSAKFRIQLKQQARAILPKNFVISTFDTSPAKKAASNLVDKAKHQVKSSGQTMPSPVKKQTMSSARKNLQKDASFRTSTNKLPAEDGDGGGYEEGGFDSESEDFSGSDEDMDTQGSDEAIDTQGSDGDDTQGTEEDSQDESQEEDDAHLAHLMAASSTLRYEPVRDEDLTRARLGKKSRDRDLTLALLAPDIVEADPQGDLRDTLFVQSYLARVKKALRGDVDTLEKFLTLMASFTKTDATPVGLYQELKVVFSSYPELLADFASFLQPEQALQCDCYQACMEFKQARTFLRKLEIYFSKNMGQYQRVMRVISRWQRKPGGREAELRDTVEPLLKGNRHLLDEFSRFFPHDRPSESMLDEFEEIQLSGSGGESPQASSCEEISLLELEETLGTKRCTCKCHSTGDDVYKMRKKHCYSCCLTVIDGELVYKVNKSTIKKVNVVYGPAISASSLLPGSANNQPEGIDMAALENPSTDQLDKTTGQSEAFAGKSDKTLSEMKPSMSMNTPESGLDVEEMNGDNDEKMDTTPAMATQSTEQLPMDGSLEEAMETADDIASEYNQEDKEVSQISAATEIPKSLNNQSIENAIKKSESDVNLPIDDMQSEGNEPHVPLSRTTGPVIQTSENSVPSHIISDTSLANDILAAAFNTALASEISLDSISFSHLLPDQKNGNSFSEDSKPESNLSESKVEEATTLDEAKIRKKTEVAKTNVGNDATIQVTDNQLSEACDLSKSPPFSPFSPFGQEIQSIMSSSTLQGACQGTNVTVTPASKSVRRITPIPVIGSFLSETSSSFQTAVANSPVLPDVPIVHSPNSQGERSNQHFGTSEKKPDSPEPMSLSAALKSARSTDAGSSSGSKDGTQLTELCSQESVPISLSVPVVHSEDANVAFPKLPTTLSNSVLLSEESLFHCFSKPPHLSDTLHSVSNLTNILYALDGTSQHGASTPSKSSSNSSLEPNTKSSLTQAKVAADNSQQSTNSQEEGNQCAIDVYNSEKQTLTSDSQSTGSSNSSEEGSKNPQGAYFPQSVQSIENMERIHRGLFAVSSLSDTDSSCVTTPSTSVTKITSGTNMEGNKEQVIKPVPVAKSPEKRPKMTRRELHKSLQCGGSEGSAGVLEEKIEDNERDDTKNVEHIDTPENSAMIKIEQDLEEGTAIVPVTCEEQGSCQVSIADSEEFTVKTETDTDMTSMCESDASSRGKKKSKHKKHKSDKEHRKKRKRKDRDADMPREKKSKRKRVEEPNDSPVNVIPQKAASSAVSSPEAGGSPEEPNWSKETDRTILETCKVHGIKDKTFHKIAKTLGTVTAKQVQTRFSHLYRVIFGGSAFSDKKEDSSSS